MNAVMGIVLESRRWQDGNIGLELLPNLAVKRDVALVRAAPYF